jgi:hypothetical protein
MEFISASKIILDLFMMIESPFIWKSIVGTMELSPPRIMRTVYRVTAEVWWQITDQVSLMFAEKSCLNLIINDDRQL